MPAGLPGSTLAENQANPSAGKAVIFDALSGPKASPFDARKITGWTFNGVTANGMPTYANDPLNISTGALCTGIGFGSPPIFGAAQIKPNFNDDYVPGRTLPDGTVANFSTLAYIGGGKSLANGTPDLLPSDEVALCMAGNGGSRDGGTTPFTGFPVKTVTATAGVANGAAVEAGFLNRSGIALVSGQSVFGSSTTPNADVT